MLRSGCWPERVISALLGRKTCLKHNSIHLIVLALLIQCWLADAKVHHRRHSYTTKFGRNFDANENLVSIAAPEFDPNTASNVTVEKGQAAFLHCKVKHQGNYMVSWVRYTKDFAIVSIGENIFIPDSRFNLIRIPGSSDWTLRILHVKQHDAGNYECQIGTTPKMARNVTLQVIEALQSDSEDLRPRVRTSGDEVARAVIKGDRDAQIGHSLNLTCYIASSGAAHSNHLIKWHHNETTYLNYEQSARSGAQIEIFQSPTGMFSRLLIRNVQDFHAGKYTCSANSAEPTTVFVHVKPSSQPMAMKRSPATRATSVISPFIFSLLVLMTHGCKN